MAKKFDGLDSGERLKLKQGLFNVFNANSSSNDVHDAAYKLSAVEAGAALVELHKTVQPRSDALTFAELSDLKKGLIKIFEKNSYSGLSNTELDAAYKLSSAKAGGALVELHKATQPKNNKGMS